MTTSKIKICIGSFASLLIVGYFSPSIVLASELFCPSERTLSATTMGFPTGLTVTNPTGDEEIEILISNDSSVHVMPSTLVVAVTKTVTDPTEEGEVVVFSPTYSATATTTPVLAPSENRILTLDIPTAKLPAGSYDVTFHAAYAAPQVVQDTPWQFVNRQTEIGSMPLTVIGDTDYSFSAIKLSLSGLITHPSGWLLDQDSRTVEATLDLTNPFPDRPLRGNVTWEIYRGAIPTSAQLLDTWSEELRLLPSRANQFSYLYGFSAEEAAGVYTLVARVWDSVSGQQWQQHSWIFSGTGVDFALPVLTAVYTENAQLMACYQMYYEPRLLSIPTTFTHQVLAPDSSEVITTSSINSESTISSFSVRLPNLYPFDLRSTVLHDDQIVTSDHVRFNCEMDECLVRTQADPTISMATAEPAYTRYLLITLAASALGVLLWLLHIRHQREQLASEAGRRTDVTQ